MAKCASDIRSGATAANNVLILQHLWATGWMEPEEKQENGYPGSQRMLHDVRLSCVTPPWRTGVARILISHLSHLGMTAAQILPSSEAVSPSGIHRHSAQTSMAFGLRDIMF